MARSYIRTDMDCVQRRTELCVLVFRAGALDRWWKAVIGVEIADDRFPLQTIADDHNDSTFRNINTRPLCGKRLKNSRTTSSVEVGGRALLGTPIHNTPRKDLMRCVIVSKWRAQKL